MRERQNSQRVTFSAVDNPEWETFQRESSTALVEQLAELREFTQQRRYALDLSEKIFAETLSAPLPDLHRGHQLAFGRSMKASLHFFNIDRRR
jgi:hypothetical protein